MGVQVAPWRTWRWVSEFVRGLMVEIRQRLGGPKDLTLFFDESDLRVNRRSKLTPIRGAV